MYNKIRNRGLAFVTMGSPEEALAALSNLESYVSRLMFFLFIIFSFSLSLNVLIFGNLGLYFIAMFTLHYGRIVVLAIQCV